MYHFEGEEIKKLMGKRILIKEKYTIFSPIEEVIIEEVSNNFNYIKIKNMINNTLKWIFIDDYIIIDVLE